MKKQLLLFASGLALSFASMGQYCTTGLYSSGCGVGDDLNSFSFATISNLNTGCGGVGGYNDFTAQNAVLVPGVTYNWSASTSYPCCEQFAMWIDYNNDTDFNDPGEYIYGSSVSGVSWSGTYMAPATAGTFRLRARVIYSSAPNAAGSCTSYTWGETEDYTITILPPVLTAVVTSPINLDCYGDANATLSANIFGGTAPFSYLWSNGSTDSAQFNMPGGTYTLTVTDNVGDTTSASIVVIEPDSIALSTSVITSLVCDYNLSQVQASGNGGTPLSGYSVDTTTANYNWDSTGVATTVLLGNNTLSPFFNLGFDFVYFGDTVDEFRIAANGFITFDGNNQTGCCDGDPIPSPTEANSAIYAIWEYHTATSSNYSYKVLGTAPFRRLVVSFEGLPICCGAVQLGAAQIVLHETSNCIEINTESYNGQAFGNRTQGIEGPGGLEAFTYPGRNGTLWNSGNSHVSFCPIDASGLLYTWSTGDVGADVYGLPAGTYTVTASDANGCETSETVTIDPGISVLVSALNATDVSCFGFDDASINPTITGGVNPVSYTWSNGATTATLSNLEPGTYSVSAEDAVGCTIEVNNITIMEPSILLASVFDLQNAICSDDENGSASIVVSGGVPPYSPLWSNGEVAYTATQLPTGPSNVVITDANGCSSVLSLSIGSEFNSPTPDIGNNFINPNGGGVILNTLPSSYSSYLWSTGATSASISAELTGFYWVEVTNDAGCTGSDTAYVEIWPTGVSEVKELVGVAMYPNPARDMINFNISADINVLNVSIVDVKGATVAQTQFNNAGVQSISLENLSAGIYSVQLSTEEGQVSTQKLVVTK